MTATPRFFTPRLRREAGLLDVEVASMDDEEVFGPVLHRLTFGEAIDRDLLSDYQVAVVGVDDETYRAWAERGEFVTRDGEKISDARTLAGQIALVKAMRKYHLQRVISFHGRVNAARQFSADVPDLIEWLPSRARPQRAIWSEHVSGKMSSGHRDRLLLRFRNLAQDEIGLLANARCLGEGVDVPTLDGVAFIDPRRSTTDIIQAVGRAIRKAPNKTLGTIVLPVFLGDDDPEQALEDSTFKSVWEVLKALRAHDEKLGKELDELRRNLGASRSTPPSPGKIKLDVPVAWVGASFVDAFNTRLVERTTESWEFWFGLLTRYAFREGHAQVPGLFKEDGYRLGGWVGEQRKFYKRGFLSEERIKRLEQVEDWTWDAREDAWEVGSGRLDDYVARGGDSRVPSDYVEADGYKLGQWVASQRAIFNRGELAPDRAERLARLPRWFWHHHRDAWEAGYLRLRRFVAREGHALVPKGFMDEDRYRLDLWVLHQRDNHRQGKLSSEQVRRLNEVDGWTWEPGQAAFAEGIDRLQRYAQRNANTLVPNDYVEDDGFQLGLWVANRRKDYKRGQLSANRVRSLNDTPGWRWDLKGDAWEEGYERLQRFIGSEGRARVPRPYQDADGYRLGSWVHNQRNRFARGALPKARVDRLDQLSGWTWTTAGARSEERWEYGYERLCVYARREREARVPHNYVDEDGFKLGQWVGVQRSWFNSGRLAPGRADKLKNLPGWTWNARDR